MQKQTECFRRIAAHNAPVADTRLRGESSIAADTVKASHQALADWNQGNIDGAVVLYRQIDANGPAIISEYRRGVPQAAPLDQRAQLQKMDMDGVVGALAMAQRRIGEYYENSGKDAVAAGWYEKANATVANIGGYDPQAATRLGFMYAHGRGVPRDRQRAAELFQHAESSFRPSRGSSANPLVYLMDRNQLPQHPSELTIPVIRQAENDEATEKLVNFLIVAGIMSGGRRSQPSTSTPETVTSCYEGGHSTACTFRMSPTP